MYFYRISMKETEIVSEYTSPNQVYHKSPRCRAGRKTVSCNISTTKSKVGSNNISEEGSVVSLFSLSFSHLLGVVFWRWEPVISGIAISPGVFPAEVDCHEDAEDARHSTDTKQTSETLEIPRTLRGLNEVESG
jgi:hypothetical protein